MMHGQKNIKKHTQLSSSAPHLNNLACYKIIYNIVRV